MALKDPVAAYNAASNLEAEFVRDLLLAAGLEAFTSEGVVYGGVWVGGVMPELHKPQVWIDRADADRAKAVLDEYEAREAARRAGVSDGPPIQAVCEECGQTTPFPTSQKGTVQNCPHCQAYLDVGDEESPDGWEADDEEPEEPAEDPEES